MIYVAKHELEGFFYVGADMFTSDLKRDNFCTFWYAHHTISGSSALDFTRLPNACGRLFNEEEANKKVEELMEKFDKGESFRIFSENWRVLSKILVLCELNIYGSVIKEKHLPNS